MSGPFGDPSDANRKPRGPRPFAGQSYPPGSGPLKSGRVRRPTLAPFPSPFAEQEPEAPVSVRIPELPPSPEPVASRQPASLAECPPEHVRPLPDLPLPAAEPEAPSAEVEVEELPIAALAPTESEDPQFSALVHAETEELPIADEGALEEHSTAPFAAADLDEQLYAPYAQDELDQAASGLQAPGGLEPEQPLYESFAEAEPPEQTFHPFADAEGFPFAPPAEEALPEHEFDSDADVQSRALDWAALSGADEHPGSALHTDELREGDLNREAPQEAREAAFESTPEADPEDDWFAEPDYVGRDDDVAEAPFENIESVGAPPPSMAAEESGDTRPESPALLPVDWAVSPDGEADLQSYVAAARVREEASEVLEGVARRVRSGEIVLALEPGASMEAVLASVLVSLLT